MMSVFVVMTYDEVTLYATRKAAEKVAADLRDFGRQVEVFEAEIEGAAENEEFDKPAEAGTET
jgi:menaquinone-dependent protoporphyrinogen IX oxidase